MVRSSRRSTATEAGRGYGCGRLRASAASRTCNTAWPGGAVSLARDTPCSHDSAVDLDMRTTKTTLAPANQLLHTL